MFIISGNMFFNCLKSYSFNVFLLYFKYIFSYIAIYLSFKFNLYYSSFDYFDLFLLIFYLNFEKLISFLLNELPLRSKIYKIELSILFN